MWHCLSTPKCESLRRVVVISHPFWFFTYAFCADQLHEREPLFLSDFCSLFGESKTKKLKKEFGDIT